MTPKHSLERRALLKRLALGLAVVSVHSRTNAAEGELTPLSESDPKAKAVDYVEDAARATGAMPGANCANCGLYSGKSGATEGACVTLFPGKSVKAAGWCKSWATF